MLKKAVQQGRSERRPEAYPQGHIEDRSEARTMLGTRRVSARRGWAGEKGDFVSILPKNYRPLRSIAKRAMVTHLGQYRLLLDHKNFTTDMPRMQVATIDQRIPLSGVEHVTGRNTDILRFARLQYHFSFHHKR